MSTADSKKVKRKKGRKPAAKISSGVGAPSLAIATGTSQQSQTNKTDAEGVEQDDVQELEKLMDEEDGVKTRLSQYPVFSKGPLPYTGGEHCLLCRCAKPASEKDSSSTKGSGSEDDVLNVQLPLWVCSDCKKTVEEEEKKGPVLEQDLRLDAPFFAEIANGDVPPAVSSICSCEACLDRRQITAELEKETQELQQCWMELRHVVRCVYREAGTGLAEPGKESADMPDISKMKELVHRLVTRDPHQLYQRLESQGREYVIEMKVRLLKQLTSGHKTPPQAKQFVSMLLEEYANLCAAAKTLASFLTELQQEHLKRFSLTWELHNKHLFQSIIYTDPLVQNSLTMLITQLRLGAASKESYHEDTYPNILHRYFKFDDEMSVISVVWRDCQQLLEEYNEEQAALKAKQKMLKEDWEFFRAQRKLLEQTVIPDPSMPPAIPTSNSSGSHNFEAQFTETMRHILQGTKPQADECHCPHCNRKRCPCDECTISHMITCGIINPEVVEQLPGHGAGAPPFQPDPSRYHINVRPPSMSSTTSSSGSSSPIIVDPERLTLPFDDNDAFDLADEEDEEEDDDDIPEDIDEGSRDSDDETSEDDNNSREDGDGEDEPQVMMAAPSCPEEIPKPMERKLLERGPTEGCDCTHCAQKAKAEQQLKLDENQCQCHACLQQSGQGVTTSLPQHLPPAPRPAALHLYPHIHGASNPTTAGLGPLLHPHLYELHTPLRGGALGQQKHQLNLDLDSHEALQEHIYHAYGEWDNTYDNTRFILNTHKYGGGGGSLGSELFNTPPPPLLNSNPFIDNSLAMNYGMPVDNIITSMAKATVPSTSSVVMSGVTGPTSTAKHEPCLKNLKPINRTLLHHASNVSKVSTMSSTTITTTTTNVTVTAAQGSGVKMDVPLIMSDHCLKHNPFIPTTSTVFSANNLNANFTAATSNASYPFKFTTEMLRSAAALKEEAARALGNLNQPTFNLGGCNHTGTQGATTNQVGSKPATSSNINQSLLNPAPLVTPGVPPHSSAAPTVAAGHQAATACPEPDCDHQDDVYDSIDDSCSEQSSSTSTSIQKEGKYCDCCYCEVFGHSNPPVAPTSKNYQEMRDRLRLRLKKKNEAKTDDKPGHGPEVECVHHEETIKSQTTPANKEEETLSTLSIEQILKYIEGGEESCKNSEKQQVSSKAAKRARQKQRKAEEKAKKQPEDAETQEMEMEDSSSQHDSLQRKKRAKQKKESSPSATSVQGNGTANTPNKKHSTITNSTTPILTNGAPAQTNHNLNKAKSKEGKLTSCANASNNHITNGKKRIDGAVTSQEINHKESPHGSPRALKNKRGHDPSMEVSQPLNRKGGVDTQTLVAQQNGKHCVKGKVSETRPENGPKHTVVPQHSQPQPVVGRNKGLQADATSRKKTRNAKVDANSQDVAESPPQVPAKQARQTRSAPALHQNNVMAQNHTMVRQMAKAQGLAEGVSRVGASPAQSDKDGRQSLVNGSKSAPNILQESNKIKPEAPGSAKKKTKKKSKATDDMTSVDEIFMPKPGLDLENGDLDESERELEEFKRFCLDSTPIKRGQKLQVNMNLKDIFSKKNKSGISCA